VEKNITQIKSFYRNDKIASSYINDRFSKPLGQVQHKIQVETINNAIYKYNVEKVLEVACGPARLTPEISINKLGVAFDSSHQMLKIAKDRVSSGKKLLFMQADAFEPGIRQRFQLVYSLRFIRHFKCSDRIKLYEEIFRLLKNKGVFIFDAVHYEKFALFRKLENKNQKLIYDKVYDTRKEIITEMNTAGFEVLELKGLVHHFYLQAIISRLSRKIGSASVGTKIIHFLEKIPFGRPLEWIVICRKI